MEAMSSTIQHLQNEIISKDEHIKALLQKKEDLENELRAEGYEFEQSLWTTDEASEAKLEELSEHRLWTSDWKNGLHLPPHRELCPAGHQHRGVLDQGLHPPCQQRRMWHEATFALLDQWLCKRRESHACLNDLECSRLSLKVKYKFKLENNNTSFWHFTGCKSAGKVTCGGK